MVPAAGHSLDGWVEAALGSPLPPVRVAARPLNQEPPVSPHHGLRSPHKPPVSPHKPPHSPHQRPQSPQPPPQSPQQPAQNPQQPTTPVRLVPRIQDELLPESRDYPLFSNFPERLDSILEVRIPTDCSVHSNGSVHGGSPHSSRSALTVAQEVILPA